MHYESNPRPAEVFERGTQSAQGEVVPFPLVPTNRLPNGGGRQVFLLPNLQDLPRNGSEGKVAGVYLSVLLQL